MPVTVQIAGDVAAALAADGVAVVDSSADTASLGGFADVAEVAAVIAGQAATLVTLASGPDVYRSVASRIRHFHGGRKRWLHARGPGGEVNLQLTSAFDEEALAALLRAVWAPDDETNDQSS